MQVGFVFVAGVAACNTDEPEGQSDVPLGTSGTTQVVGQSWDVCTWLGPLVERPGVFGSDLGFEVPVPSASGAPEELQLLFGDTWAEATDACSYPVLTQDDLAVRVPRQKPESLVPGPPTAAGNACDMFYPLEDPADPTSWRRMRLFPDASDRAPERALDTGMNRTPLTAWSDGTNTFAIWYRDEHPRCNDSSACPAAMTCSKDPTYQGKPIGGCEPQVAITSDPAPLWCRDNADCASPASCAELPEGVCIANTPFAANRGGQLVTPGWHTDDPRAGIASVLHVASAFWPDRPEDYATGFRFATNKFINVTARTVAHFDPTDPSQNDYRPGNETLLLWGRPGFVGRQGFQPLPFLLYQPLAGMLNTTTGEISWAPRYFAGYDASGAVIWSEQEAEAQPIYGLDENLVDQGGSWRFDWKQPEFDYVNQMSMTWVDPLQRWVMLYGGETPGEVDPSTGERPTPGFAQALPGAVHLRSAVHPWGRTTADAPASEGFGPPRPVLTRATVAAELACGSDGRRSDECNAELPERPGDLLGALGSAVSDFAIEDIVDASAKCSAGSVALDSQYVGDDAAGHMYGAAIIEAWTADVSSALPDLAPGDRAVELYWNISTWNPYSVLLIKTQLRASELTATP
ncbi:MAG: hypothetical protein ABW321_23945 [Polyangiales bacterium]